MPARAGADVFFQRAEIWGFSVMIDYWPRRLDLAALKAGNLTEVSSLPSRPEGNEFSWRDVHSCMVPSLACRA